MDSVDCILLLDVLEHTNDFYELALLAANKSNKYLIISLPNELFVYDRIRLLLGKEHPAHSLDLVDLPDGFKHQFLINISKAKSLLCSKLSAYSFQLEHEVRRELIPKNLLLQPAMKALSVVASPSLWSMGSVFVFKKIPD